MRKVLIIVLSEIMILSSFSIVYADRELVGTTTIKDNMLFINENSIPAAQLPNQFVYLKVNDLEHYGFDVELDESSGKKIYTVTCNEKKGVHPNEVPSGDEKVNVYTTDAEVYIDSDVPANVFELENGTVLIQSDELAKYGSYDWNPETHKINIDLKSSNLLKPYQPFHNAIGVESINEIKYGVLVDNTKKKCANIDYEDLKKWLDVYWNFEYDRVIAPLSAFDLSKNYVKLWNEDKSKSYTVYSNSSVIVGKYGESYESHGEIKQNYIWYLPRMGNSRSVLNTANTTLNFTYFHKVDEVEYKGDKQRQFTQADEREIPKENLLITDIASEWAKPEIEKAAACNLMLYDLSDKYTHPITRYEFCRLIYRLIVTEFKPNTDSRLGVSMAMQYIITEKSITGAYEERFSDCSYSEVNTLTAMGIINGMGDGTFAPDEYITREQAAAILYRTAEFIGNKTMKQPDYNKLYNDEKNISDWAISPVASMKAMGIMQGISEEEFAPKETYTVEQAIATMLRLYECY